MKHLSPYVLFKNSKTRTSPLTEEEFLRIFREKCTQFSLSNDMLYRGCGDIGKYALYKEAPREGTYGAGYSYIDFFNQRKDYPVPRYKSTIGSTSALHASVFGQKSESVYLVIPFDNSKIIFCSTADMAYGAFRNKIEYSDDMFVMQQYSKNFKIKWGEISVAGDVLKKAGGRPETGDGVEFFTNADCLLYYLGSGSSGPGEKLIINGSKLNQTLLNKSMANFAKLISTDPHLESNSFNETKDLINTINDICEDARDDGFEVKIKPDDDITIKMLSLYRRGSVDGPRKEINVSFTKEEFEIDDLKPTIDRLVKYMKSEDFYYHLEYVSELAKRAGGVSMRSPIPRRIDFDVLNDYLSTPSDFTFSSQLDNKLRNIKLVFTAKFGTTQLELPIEEKFEIRKVKKMKKHSSKGGVGNIIHSVGGKDKSRYVDFYGDFDEVTNKQINKALPTLEEIMDRLKVRYEKYNLGVDVIKYVNSGAFGMAFIAGDKVIKLTSNKNEAKIAKGLIGKKLKRCVGYYDVVRIKEYGIYAILMDKAEKLSKVDKKIVQYIEDDDYIMSASHREIEKEAKHAIKVALSGIKSSKDYFIDMVYDFIKLKKTLEDQKIPTQDLHVGNIGKMNGKLVHFDIMGDSSASVSKIKKLSI